MFTSISVPPTVGVAAPHHVDPTGEHGPTLTSGKTAYIPPARGAKPEPLLREHAYEGTCVGEHIHLKMERIDGAEDGYVSTGYYDSMRSAKNVGGLRDASSAITDLTEAFGEDGEGGAVPGAERPERAGSKAVQEPMVGAIRSSMRQSSSLKDLVAYEEMKAAHYKHRKPSRHSTAPVLGQAPVPVPPHSQSAPATPQPDGDGQPRW